MREPSLPTPAAPTPKPPKLLDRLRDALRARHDSLRIEEAYVQGARRYLLFHNKRHPQEMGGKEINPFLTHLAVEVYVAASTQNQALAAVRFLYDKVLERAVGERGPIVRAKRLPVVLTRQEVRGMLDPLEGT